MREGFYGFYYTGAAGSGQILTCLVNGKLVGIDPAGGGIDGTYELGAGSVKAKCTFRFPAGAELVTGQTLAQPLTIQTEFQLSEGFFEGQTERVDIGLGPMNARGVFVSDPL